MTRTYCIEIDWEEHGRDRGEPSVRHLLQIIEGLHGSGYTHRVAATMCEMRYWLDELSRKTPADCSILYLATHGDPGWISLPDQNNVALSDMPDRFPKDFARGRLVHFSGCKVLRNDKQDDCQVSNDDLDEFLKRTGASAVSGFMEEAGWAEDLGPESESYPPAVALEFMYLSSIRALSVNPRSRKSMEDNLPSLACRLQARFPECGFRLRTRWDRSRA